ncbi:MAG: hypothetical protein PHN82_11335 [bacterium]|nr:hypothetical protein [bacterium]
MTASPRYRLAPCLPRAALAAVLSLASAAAADTVHLRKGGRITGVIISETEGSIEIKSNLGTIVLSTGAVSRIERATEEENAALEAQWRKERDQEKEKEREARRFEEEQREKGLVQVEGAWVTAERAQEMQAGAARDREEWQQTAERQKQELEELERRLREIETRLDQRQRDLDAREGVLSLREQNILIQQQNLQRQAEQLSRDRQESPPKVFAVPRIDVVPPPPSGR